MGAVKQYLSTAVDTNPDQMIKFRNPYTEDYSFGFTRNNDSGEQMYEVPAGVTVQLPRCVAMHGAIQLARDIVYKNFCKETINPVTGVVESNASKWKGSHEVQWLPIAESIIVQEEEKKVVVPEKVEVIEQDTQEAPEQKRETLPELNVKNMLWNDLQKECTAHGIKMTKKKRPQLEEELLAAINNK